MTIVAVIINILGFDPVLETVEALRGNQPIGAPVISIGESGHVWLYIFMGDDVRKPNDLEGYLFRRALKKIAKRSESA